MTSTQHGLASVAENLFMGSMAVEIKVHGESLLMSDREFRDVLACARELFPSMFQWPLPAPEAKREPAAPFPLCLQCGHKVAQVIGRFCGDECEHNWRVSDVRGWYPR